MTSLSWNNCPSELMWEIFKILEDATLLICLKVNLQWKAVACSMLMQRHGSLERAVKNILPDVEELYRNKTHLYLKDSYVNSLLWYNVSNSTINFYGSCGRTVRYISTYKDFLITVNAGGVSYYNMQDNRLIRWLNIKCWTYDEGDNLVMMTKRYSAETILMSIFIKRKNRPGFLKHAAYRSPVIVFRFVEDSCYFVNKRWCLFCIKINKRRTNIIKTSFGMINDLVGYIIALNVNSKRSPYVLVNNGSLIPGTTMPGLAFYKCYMCIPSPDCVVWTPASKVCQFASAMIDLATYEYGIKYNETSKIFNIMFRGIVCACDHGNVLLIGYNDGKVNIFMKSKLENRNFIPEQTFNVYDYYTGPICSPCRGIRQIIVYEAMGSHILCIIIESVAIKLLVENLELINSDTHTEDVDELCLSVIHLLNIEI